MLVCCENTHSVPISRVGAEIDERALAPVGSMALAAMPQQITGHDCQPYVACCAFTKTSITTARLCARAAIVALSVKTFGVGRRSPPLHGYVRLPLRV